MDPEHNKTARGTVNAEEDASFARATAVAAGWIADFLFLRLCRSFKKADLDEFNEGLDTFEGNVKLLTTITSNLTRVSLSSIICKTGCISFD